MLILYDQMLENGQPYIGLLGHTVLPIFLAYFNSEISSYYLSLLLLYMFFFVAAFLLLVLFYKYFSFLFQYFFVIKFYVLNNFFAQYKHTYWRIRASHGSHMNAAHNDL